MILYIQTYEFIKGGMFLRIKSAEKRRDIREGEGVQMDLLRIKSAGKRRDIMGESEKGCAWECNAENVM